MSCKLRPSAEVSESQLVDLYGLGKGPIRRALAQLVRDDLVAAYPRRGYVVAPVTLEYVRDVMDVRAIVEPPAAGLAARHIAKAEIEKYLNVVLKDCEWDDHRGAKRHLQANIKFGRLIADASGNVRLAKVMYELLAEMERLGNVGIYLRASSPFPTYKSLHKVQLDAVSRLAKALEMRNPEGASKARADQVEIVRELIVATIMSCRSIGNVELAV